MSPFTHPFNYPRALRCFAQLWILLAIGIAPASAQLVLTNLAPSATIDFSNSMQTTVGSNPSTAFAGAGFAPSPTTAGQLNSNAWAVTGWSDGDLDFGGTRTTASTDYRRGITAVAITTGGMYAFTGAPGSASNPTLMIQQGGSDWEPGTLTLRLQNNGTTAITELQVSYNIYVRNDQGRSSFFNFSHSSDGTSFTAVAALNYSTPVDADAAGWVLVGTSPSRSTTLTGLNIAPGAYYYFRWSGGQGSPAGSGSRDEIGLDDIAVSATYADPPTLSATKLAITNVSPSSPFAGGPFSVTVVSQNDSNIGTDVETDTEVELTVFTGDGVLSGTATGTITAGSQSSELSGLSYSVVQSGVVLQVSRLSGDVLSSGQSGAITFQESATNLTISSVNTGVTVFSGVPFSVVVTSRNSLNVPQVVLADTDVELTVSTGNGVVSGTISGTILSGQSSVTISGVIYNVYETGVILGVDRTSGDNLTSGVSAPFNVVQGLQVGDISIVGYNSNTPDQGFAFVTWEDLGAGTVIKFTDCGWNNTNTNATGAARASEQTVIWTNSTGEPIVAGTVIRIVNLTASLGTASGGASNGLSGISTGGDQLIAYQGPATSGTYPDYSTSGVSGTFAGRVIYGLTFGTSGWRTSGAADANSSYLPSHLNVTNGNIAIVNSPIARDAQYTGSRNGFSTFADYKAAVNNPSNWTLNTTTTAITIDLTEFTLATGSAVTFNISEVNGGLNPSANVPFFVEVQSLDDENGAAPVAVNTSVSIAVQTGSGTLSGTTTGVIPAGSSNVFVGPMIYDVEEGGVVLSASGDLDEGFSAAFDVVGGAVSLGFANLALFQYFQNNVPTFNVQALRSDNTIDTQYNGPVTISLFSGLGALNGTLTQNAVNGVATFAGLSFNQIGNKVLRATSGSLPPANSPQINVSFAYFTEILMPQYMQGVNGANNNRVPVAFRAVIQGLIPNTTYRYFNLAVDESSSPTINGAGVCIVPDASGFNRITTPSFSLVGSYGEFTTNSNGNYTGWFLLEASANDIFTPGNEVFMRINLNNGQGGTSVALRLTSSQSMKVLNFTGSSQGTALRGTSFATPRNFVAAYDNVAGTGRPISIALVEDDLLTAPASYANFYRTQVDGVAGSWGMIIPNDLSNGIRRIEQRRSDNGQRVDCGNLDGDGVWPSGANTVNPTSGATAIHITSNDAALRLSEAPTSINATYTSICPGNTITLSVNGGSLHQGGLWRWFVGSCGPSGIATGPSITVSPTVTTTYFVRGETSCHQTACASITIVVGNCPSNDLRPFAANIVPNIFGTCSASNASLTTATESPESNSETVTGQDVWYRFIANSVGATIVVNTTSFDAVIELQDAAGNTLAVENAFSGIGSEVLHYYDPNNELVSGQQYFIAVRNFNSALGTGPFSVCVQRIRRPSCNAEPPFLICNQFKSVWVGASSYTFTYTNVNTSQVISVTTANGLTTTPLSALIPDQTYQVAIDAHFTLSDGAGNPVNFTVGNANACEIYLQPHADVVLRPQDRCAAGPRPINGLIAAEKWVCGAANYEWRFKQVAPLEDLDYGLPVASPPVNRFINLAQLSLVPGATYDVQIRPVFPGGFNGNWGPVHCLQIIGPATMDVMDSEEGGVAMEEFSHSTSPEVVLYPNPNQGDRMTLVLSSPASAVHLRVIDNAGREVNRAAWFADGSLRREFVFDNPLSPGMYIVEVIADEHRTIERMIVQR